MPAGHVISLTSGQVNGSRANGNKEPSVSASSGLVLHVSRTLHLHSDHFNVKKLHFMKTNLAITKSQLSQRTTFFLERNV